MSEIGTQLLQDVRHFNEATPFLVRGTDRLTIERDGTAAHLKVISPFVWREDDGYKAIFRAVPRGKIDDTHSKLMYAEGDGMHFRLMRSPILAPDGAADADGCEDATVLCDGNGYIVFYTSVSADGENSKLCFASGPDLTALRKCGPVRIEPSFDYSKEVATFKVPGGVRNFYFETIADGASVIAGANENGSLDHWCNARMILEPRPGYWDCAHVSTGPVVDVRGKPTMLYNGCDDDGRWRIGVATFDAQTGALETRTDEPLFQPFPLGSGLPDIVFASSALWVQDELLLYYTRGDAEPRRLRLAVR
jgi:predicted GH43/DUF377 family glycosyl hydrolase